MMKTAQLIQRSCLTLLIGFLPFLTFAEEKQGKDPILKYHEERVGFIFDEARLPENYEAYARTPGMLMRFASDHVNHVIQNLEGQRFGFHKRFLGTCGEVPIEARDTGRLGKPAVNVLGKDGKAKPTAKRHSELWYRDLYEGIDLRYYNKGKAEIGHDFVVSPGADAAQIRFQFEGLEGLAIGKTGNLLLATPLGRVQISKPFAYQVIDGKEIEVESRYVEVEKGVYRFELGIFDPGQVLVIDPTTLIDVECMLGTAFYIPQGGIATQATDDGVFIWSFGPVHEELIDYPATPGTFIDTLNTNAVYGAFIAKLNLEMDTILGLTYIAFGVGNDLVLDMEELEIEVDPSNGDIAFSTYFYASKNVHHYDFPSAGESIYTNTSAAFFSTQSQPSGYYVGRISADLTQLKYGSIVATEDWTTAWVYGMKVWNGYTLFIVDAYGQDVLLSDIDATPGAYDTLKGNTDTDKYIMFIVGPTGSLDYITYLNPPNVQGLNVRNLHITDDGRPTLLCEASVYRGVGPLLPITPNAYADFNSEPGRVFASFDRYLYLMQFAPISDLGNGTNDLTFASAIPAIDPTVSFTSEHMDSRGSVVYIASYNSYGSLPLAGDPWQSEALYPLPSWIGAIDTADGNLLYTTLIDDFDVNAITLDDCGTLYASGILVDNDYGMPPDAHIQSADAPGGNQAVFRLKDDLSDMVQGTYLTPVSGLNMAVSPIDVTSDGRVFMTMITSHAESYSVFDSLTDHEELFSCEPLFPAGYPNWDDPVASFTFSTLLLQVPTNDLFLCPGTPLTLDVLDVCGGLAPYSYSWKVVSGLNMGGSITGTNSATPTITIFEDTILEVSVTDGYGAVDREFVRLWSVDGFADLAGEDRYICSGESTVLGTPNLPVNITGSWTPTTGLDDPNSMTPTATPTASTTYNLVYTGCHGVVTSDSVFVGVDVDPQTLVNAGPDLELCFSDVANLGVPAYLSDHFVYQWTPTDFLDDPTAAYPEINFITDDVVYTLLMSNTCNGLTATDTVTVVRKPGAVNAGPDYPLCKLTDLVIGNPPHPDLSNYSWSFVDPGTPGTLTNPTSPNPTVNFTGEGSWEVQLVASSVVCGVGTDIMKVVVFPDPIPNAGPDDLLCVDYPSRPDTWVGQIGTPAVDNATYSWSPTTYLSDPNAAEPIVETTVPGSYTYVLTMTDICFGVEYKDTVTVTTVTNQPFVDAYESPFFDLFDLDGDTTNNYDGIAGNNILGYPCYLVLIGMEPREDVEYWWEPQTALVPWYDPFRDIQHDLDYPVVWSTSHVAMTYTLYAQDTCSGFISSNQVTIVPSCGGGGSGGNVTAPRWPKADAGPSEVWICANQSIQIGTPAEDPTFQYTWFPTNDLDNPNIAEPTVITPSIGRTYTLTVINPDGGFTDSDQITVHVVEDPIAHAGFPTNFSCPSDINYQLGPPIGATEYENPNWLWIWEPTTGLDDPYALRPTLTGPDIALQYGVTVWDPRTDCASTALVTFTVSDTFADAGTNQCVCYGDAALLGTPTPTNGSTYSYHWEPSDSLDASDAAQVSAAPTETTEYTLTVTRTDSNGVSCVDVSRVTVEVKPGPVFSLPGDRFRLCQSEPPFVVSPSVEDPSWTFQWTASPSGAISALSSTNTGTTTISPTNLAVGSDNTFTLTATATNGCSYSDSIRITMADTTDLTITLGNATGCEGQQVRYFPRVRPSGIPYTFGWSSVDDPTLEYATSPGSLFTFFIVGSSNRTYTLTVTNTCSGQVVSNSTTIIPRAPAEFSVPSVIAACPGDTLSIPITVSNGTVHSWTWTDSEGNTGTGSGTTVTYLAQSVSSTINLSIRSTSGCFYDFEISVQVDAPEIVLEPATICSGGPHSIGVAPSSGVSYAWSVISGDPNSLPANTNTAMISVTPTNETVYQLVVNDPAYSCPNSNTVTVSIYTNPLVAEAGPDVVMLCPDEFAQLGTNAVEGYTYQWSPPVGLTDPTVADPFTEITVDLVYTLVVTDVCSGQMATDTVAIVFGITPLADAGPDQTVCEGAQPILSNVQIASNAVNFWWSPSTFLSSTNATNPVVTMNQNISAPLTMTYTLHVDDGTNCVAEDEVDITFMPVPELNYPQELQICAGESITLGDALAIRGMPSNSYTITWDAPIASETNINPVVSPQLTTVYRVTVTGESGCEVTRSILVRVVNEQIYASASVNCPSNSATFSVTDISGATYDWSGPNGSVTTNREFILGPLGPGDFGTYTVLVTLVEGCVLTDTVFIVDDCPCDLVASNFTTGSCVEVAGVDYVEIGFDLAWGPSFPAGEQIHIYSLGDTNQEVWIDPAVQSSPQTVSILVPENTLPEFIRVEFETDTDCGLIIQATPGDCPDCVISSTVVTTTCDGKGTPDTSDDTWSVTVYVEGQGSTYALTGDLSASNLAYNVSNLVTTTLSASVTSVSFVVTDEESTNCVTNLVATNAGPCSPPCPPVVITCPSNVTLECGSSTDPADTGMPTGLASYVDSITTGACPQNVTIERVWTATNFCGQCRQLHPDHQFGRHHRPGAGRRARRCDQRMRRGFRPGHADRHRQLRQCADHQLRRDHQRGKLRRQLHDYSHLDGHRRLQQPEHGIPGGHRSRHHCPGAGWRPRRCDQRMRRRLRPGHANRHRQLRQCADHQLHRNHQRGKLRRQLSDYPHLDGHRRLQQPEHGIPGGHRGRHHRSGAGRPARRCDQRMRRGFRPGHANRHRQLRQCADHQLHRDHQRGKLRRQLHDYSHLDGH